jgi:hypothetical protein
LVVVQQALPHGFGHAQAPLEHEPEQVLPHAPQLSGSVWRLASQPLLQLPSQLVYPP